MTLHSKVPLILFVVLMSSPVIVEGCQARAERGSSYSPDDFLKALGSIPEWASKLEGALRNQGTEIDRKKETTQILAFVVAIQKDLSGLEDINNKIIGDLRPDARRHQRDNLYRDLNSAADSINLIKTRFSTLRENVEAMSIPEVTEIERLGELDVGSRGGAIRETIEMLGYRSDSETLSEKEYVAMKKHSEAITKLLHEAQDAFGKLHHDLES